MSLKLSFLVTGLSLLAPALGLCTAVSINSTCQAGSCSSPDSLSSGQSVGSSLNQTLTLSDGDQFYVTGAYGASYTGGQVNISADPVAVYIGNVTSKTAASQADTLTFNFYQTYNFQGSTAGYYYYYAISDTSGAIAPNSTYTANLSWNGEPIGATSYGVGYSSTNLFNQKLYSDLTSPLTADESLSMFFGAGSDPGAAFTTITPEPSSILLLSVGLIGLAAFGFQNTRQKAAEARS